MKVFASLTSIVLATAAAVAAQRDTTTCIDQPDDVVAALAASAGYDGITGCSSSLLAQAIESGVCKEQSQQGEVLRTNCCRTCVEYYYPMPETQLPQDGGGPDKPVKLYLQAGQSECVGQASTSLLREHVQDTGEYSDLVVEQDGVYLAAYAKGLGNADPYRFFISTMQLGKTSSGIFGPEIAIGRRLQDASPDDVDVMIVKYCWGGSNVAYQWNPDRPANWWNRTEDDGSSDHLLDVGAADLNSKYNLYGNLIYTARRTVEALTEANIEHEWAGMFWIQGAADKDRTWEEYGTDLKRLFTRVREDIGVDNLPIVDTGADVHHSLYSGKIYSASTIENCNVKVAQANMGVADPESDCIPGPTTVCEMFNNYEPWLYYGLDPAMTVPPYSDMLPPSLIENNKTFTWFREFPTNQHSEYDGMILKGRSVANEYIRTFTDWTLTDDMIVDDPVVRYPVQSCGRPVDPGYEAPSDDNVCLIDERDDDAMDAVSCDVDTGLGVRRLKLAGSNKGGLRTRKV